MLRRLKRLDPLPQIKYTFLQNTKNVPYKLKSLTSYHKVQKRAHPQYAWR